MGHETFHMDIVVGLACVLGVALVIGLLCRCCCSSSYRGRVLQPPPDPNTSTAPYPQQQYAVAVPTVTAVPVGHNVSAYPAYPATYPAAPYQPAPYPAAAPYQPAPYPAAPYPAGASAMPQPHLPSAPEVNAFIGVAPPGWHTHALPPSYEQVMSAAKHSSPYNPNVPH